MKYMIMKYEPSVLDFSAFMGATKCKFEYLELVFESLESAHSHMEILQKELDEKSQKDYDNLSDIKRTEINVQLKDGKVMKEMTYIIVPIYDNITLTSNTVIKD